MLIGLLAVGDFVTGNVSRAVLVAVLGSVLVGLAPDAIVRPRLASRAAHLPTSLYFIGFTGGLLTLGAVGFIAGPLVVALLEAVALPSAAGPGHEQRTLGELATPPEGPGEPVDGT